MTEQEKVVNELVRAWKVSCTDLSIVETAAREILALRKRVAELEERLDDIRYEKSLRD